MFLSWQLLGSCCCTWTGGKQRHWLGEGLALPSPMHPSCRRTKAISNHHSWLLPHAWRCVGSGGRWVSPHHSGAGSTPRSTHCHHAPGSSSRTYRLQISARKKRREWNGRKKMKEGFPLAHANNSDLEYLFRYLYKTLQLGDFLCEMYQSGFTIPQAVVMAYLSAKRVHRPLLYACYFSLVKS